MDTSTHRGQRMPRSERRAQLLEAAQSVFVERGYHAAAMDDIAEHAGVSKPVLYQHFPGKLELYLALLDAHCETLERLVREALSQPADSNEDRVQATTGAYFDFVAREDGAFRMIFESDLTSEPQVRARLDSVELACAEAIAEVIAHDAGIPEEQAMLVASGLAGMSQITARYWLAAETGLKREEAAGIASSLIWRGIGSLPLVGGERSEAARG
ncbi:TetR/AcrR family transcriptional regulator [Knoellia subterranea]|uniref:TetR family transcriptional regulator n=1 Tax=Knoellia subterranea KCTC 19937 TaxID=1385521 RepID=A0A0A0JPL2_9MICO|nr:TetR/AcrR family transcriptional regulator [Knoellia subterranea]KGN39395.1 TetR family transcriptional regulator [Knoellia subterranea KCTC 19937]